MSSSQTPTAFAEIGVPADIDPTQYASLVELMEESFRKFGDRCAYSFLGKDTTFGSKDDVTDMGETVTYRATCSELRSTRAVPRGDIDSGVSSPLCVITQKGDRVTVRVVSADPVKIRVVASSGAVATYKGYRKVYVYKT